MEGREGWRDGRREGREGESEDRISTMTIYTP